MYLFMINAAMTYQEKCLLPDQQNFFKNCECYVNDLDRVTSAESHDYDFENENKKLKHILSQNPTLDDFRKVTLVYDEAISLDKKVREMHVVRQNVAQEPGLPNMTGAVIEMRQFFRVFLGDPTEKCDFTNFEGQNLNEQLLDWENLANERRSKYFDEILDQQKFTQVRHENKKIQVLAAGESFKELYANVLEHIHDEDDSQTKSTLLMKLANLLSTAKSEGSKISKLRKFRGELLDSNISEDEDV